MMLKQLLRVAINSLIWVGAGFTVFAQQPSEALQDWKNDKFSMFIHFGIYSVLGGVWEGKPVTRGYSEQIQAHAGIYSDVYADVANRFDPESWNADSVAILAKEAGMHAIVITSKHHDGFCMFHSAYTDFNIVDGTPYKRDIVKELADACHRHGLKFGVYFSLIDWHFPQAYPISSSNSDPITPEHHAYNLKQVTELLSNYGPISEIWFDMGSLTRNQSSELYQLVHRLQPDCMVSGRLGNDRGDFCVMGDNDYPDYKIATPWQTPASMFNETWGYRSWQKRGDPAEKAREKLVSLINVVSRGGNFLLNIGPEGNGSVVPFEKEVLRQMGHWLGRNGEAIYGTDANPFPAAFQWGEVTTRPGILYLHLLAMPDQHTILLKGLQGKLKKVYILDDATLSLQPVKKAEGYEIGLPVNLDLSHAIKVLVLQFENGFTITPPHQIQPEHRKSVLILNETNAIKHYTISGVDYDSYYRSTMKNSWMIGLRHSIRYRPWLQYTREEKGRRINLSIDGVTTPVSLAGGEAVPIPQTATLSWGPLYAKGPFGGGINGVEAAINNVDPAQPWPRKSDNPWLLKSGWKKEGKYTLPTERDQNWYILQEITSTADQPLLVRITSGDGIQVIFNGETLFVHNNPARAAEMDNLILLPLKSGKNQLIVKLYNRFKKQTPLGISDAVPQVVYRKSLEACTIKGNKTTEISWQLHQPDSVRQAMDLPNLTLELKPLR